MPFRPGGRWPGNGTNSPQIPGGHSSHSSEQKWCVNGVFGGKIACFSCSPEIKYQRAYRCEDISKTRITRSHDLPVAVFCGGQLCQAIYCHRCQGLNSHYFHIQVEPGKPGAEVSKKKYYKSKKVFAYRMCTGWPTTAMPKPTCLSERAFSRSMVVMWWPVLMWLVAGSDEVDVRCNVVSCEMSCHVMWCNLMCLHFMWCDFLCCVMSRNALRCHVMSSHVMSCHLLWSDAVQWDEILWVCDALWLVAMSRCVVRNGCVGWIGRWSGDPNYTDLLRTTQYYKVLLRYYSVLHCTTPVLLCTTKYYSSTNFVLQSTTPVLLCARKSYSSTTPVLLCTTKYYSVLQSTTPVLLRTAKYYSSTTLYYKVLLQCYSVLQSTTPVLLCTTKYYSSTTLYYNVLLQY